MLDLLPKLGDDTYYTPFFIGELLCKHAITIVNGVRISKFTMMKYLIQNKHVPVGKTTLYKLDLFVSFGLVPKDTSWSELGTFGRKALLTPRELMWFILEVKNETRGGKAMSSKDVRNKLEQYVYQVHAKKGTLYNMPTCIPDYTLNAFVSTIKAQCLFNIYDAVGNKTGSRAIAEWSLRSTLAYAMVVTCNHFLPNIVPNYYHPKKKDLNQEALSLWNIAELAYNRMIGNHVASEKQVPVLPNLVTTTDEVTIFATAGTVHKKETFFLVARPDELKNESCDSGKRNHYKKNPSGNAHCRGVRVVINSTFTAGGLSAPIFVAVYGLTREEMPNDDIITIAVPGLVAGSSQNLYSTGEGFITFVCGSESNSERVDTGQNNSNPISPTTDASKYSKESQVASLYRSTVYYPFIKKIRKDKYKFDGNDVDIPDYLTAVSWMDGCSSQLKLITSPENMDFEKKKKIVCCKHSAARTAAEQAVDTGCMFKEMKRIINETENLHSSNSSVYRFLDQAISSLEPTNRSNINTTMRVLNLPLHKKKRCYQPLPNCL